MKMILKNTTIEFLTYVQKLNWTWDNLIADEGYLEGHILKNESGNVVINTASGTSVSGLIDLPSNAVSIDAKCYTKRYSAMIAFFNSAVSDTVAVHYVQGTGIGDTDTGMNIDSSIIAAAVAAGADSFRVSFSQYAPANKDCYVNINVGSE